MQPTIAGTGAQVILSFEVAFIHRLCSLKIQVTMYFEVDWSAMRLDGQMHQSKPRWGNAGLSCLLQAHVTGVRECLRVQQTS